MLLILLGSFVSTLGVVLGALIIWHRWKFPLSSEKERVIAFFHPYCSSGGGGERVLWAIVQALGEIEEQGLPIKVLIYTVDLPSESYKKGEKA